MSGAYIGAIVAIAMGAFVTLFILNQKRRK
jgi:hypothetical protein